MFKKFFYSLLIVSVMATMSSAESLNSEQKSKVTAKLEQLKLLGTDETVVREVKALTANPPLQGMTSEKWKTLTLISPEVNTLVKNSLATYLKTKKDESITELFVSDSAGYKLAFFSKTTSICHKGTDKHDVPMTAKTCIGEIEVDESTGMQQVQVSFPVLVVNIPSGRKVVGLLLSKQ